MPNGQRGEAVCALDDFVADHIHPHARQGQAGEAQRQQDQLDGRG